MLLVAKSHKGSLYHTERMRERGRERERARNRVREKEMGHYEIAEVLCEEVGVPLLCASMCFRGLLPDLSLTKHSVSSQVQVGFL